MVQALPPYAAKKSLALGVHVWCPHRRLHDLDATEFCHAVEGQAELRVAVADEEPWTSSMLGRGPQLLSNPLGRRPPCDADVDHAPPVQLHDEECKDGREANVEQLKEVAGPDIRPMIADEGGPVLAPWTLCGRSDVLLYCPFADADPASAVLPESSPRPTEGCWTPFRGSRRSSGSRSSACCGRGTCEASEAETHRGATGGDSLA